MLHLTVRFLCKSKRKGGSRLARIGESARIGPIYSGHLFQEQSVYRFHKLIRNGLLDGLRVHCFWMKCGATAIFGGKERESNSWEVDQIMFGHSSPLHEGKYSRLMRPRLGLVCYYCGFVIFRLFVPEPVQQCYRESHFNWPGRVPRFLYSISILVAGQPSMLIKFIFAKFSFHPDSPLRRPLY